MANSNEMTYIGQKFIRFLAYTVIFGNKLPFLVPKVLKTSNDDIAGNGRP